MPRAYIDHVNMASDIFTYKVHIWLSSVQTSHWHTIFAAFNEQYDSPSSYTLNYFLEKDLEKFKDLISEVHCLASQQSMLREKVALINLYSHFI